MYYPKNFPRELENSLLSLLKMLEAQFAHCAPRDAKEFNRLLLKNLKTLPGNFGGEKPSLWWLNFTLMRHGESFRPGFIRAIDPFLTKTKIRSLSGVVPLSLFTKGRGCPFNCVYCPNEPGVPKSYFSDEPAVMRAIRHNFDPFEQTLQRLVMFVLSNHPVDKVEVIIKGGTFSFYPRPYRKWFVKRIFDAANCDVVSFIKTGKLRRFRSSSLEEAQSRNEKAKSRIIGINVETRPDYINLKEVRFLRTLGVTHVEMGVQALDDEIYRLIRRGHTVRHVADATRLLKNAGFKVGYHLMPNLPGTTPEKDSLLLGRAFGEDDFKPDHLKLYPTTVTKHTVLSRWLKDGSYIPYPVADLIRVITRFKSETAPPWVRIGRLTRDITTNVMEGDGIAPNMREVIQAQMEKENLKCRCIRCREIRDQKPAGGVRFRSIAYEASGAREFFLEYTDEEEHSLGFLRLRLPGKSLAPLGVLEHRAIIRELHVYGQAVPIGQKDGTHIQHRSIGASLMEQAEKIARIHEIKRMGVIAGVGTREYYRKFGYRLEGTYMVRNI